MSQNLFFFFFLQHFRLYFERLNRLQTINQTEECASKKPGRVYDLKHFPLINPKISYQASPNL